MYYKLLVFNDAKHTLDRCGFVFLPKRNTPCIVAEESLKQIKACRYLQIVSNEPHNPYGDTPENAPRAAREAPGEVRGVVQGKPLDEGAKPLQGKTGASGEKAEPSRDGTACPYCDFVAASKRGLLTHIRMVHPESYVVFKDSR